MHLCDSLERAARVHSEQCIERPLIVLTRRCASTFNNNIVSQFQMLPQQWSYCSSISSINLLFMFILFHRTLNICFIHYITKISFDTIASRRCSEWRPGATADPNCTFQAITRSINVASKCFWSSSLRMSKQNMNDVIECALNTEESCSLHMKGMHRDDNKRWIPSNYPFIAISDASWNAADVNDTRKWKQY